LHFCAEEIIMKILSYRGVRHLCAGQTPSSTYHILACYDIAQEFKELAEKLEDGVIYDASGSRKTEDC